MVRGQRGRAGVAGWDCLVTKRDDIITLIITACSACLPAFFYGLNVTGHVAAKVPCLAWRRLAGRRRSSRSRSRQALLPCFAQACLAGREPVLPASLPSAPPPDV